MELSFIEPGFPYIMDRILDFQKDETASFWSDPLYHFYPQLDRNYAQALPLPERRKYLTQVLRQIYEDQREGMSEKVRRYTLHWNSSKGQITEALSDAFEMDCEEILNDMQARISLNPIAPRFLQEHAFDIFWLNSEQGAIGEAIHEIIHFVWFHVWRETFADDWEEYEAPSMKWILSEMVVESIMKDERLASINPYFLREHGGCIYPYFFDMRVDGMLILEVLDDMYKSMGIREFMKASYRYCLAHEQEIRSHIAGAEKDR